MWKLLFSPLLPQPVCCLAVWVARNVPQLVSATVTKQMAVRSALASLGCRFGCSVLGGGAVFCGRELGCSVPLKNEEMGICITWVPAQNISLGGDINTNSLTIEAFPEMDQRSKWRTANAWKILVSNVWARIHLAAVRIPISLISFFLRKWEDLTRVKKAIARAADWEISWAEFHCQLFFSSSVWAHIWAARLVPASSSAHQPSLPA